MIDWREEVTKERVRQISEEGWTEGHDDKHVNGELLDAAFCYLMPFDSSVAWPFEPGSFKPKNPERDLVRAAALALAELARLKRAGLPRRAAWVTYLRAMQSLEAISMMTDGMDFEEALRVLKGGYYVRRKGWNGKDAFIYLASLRLIDGDGEDIVRLEPCIVMRTQDGKHQPGWLASQADLLAYDWERVPVEAFSEARILE